MMIEKKLNIIGYFLIIVTLVVSLIHFSVVYGEGWFTTNDFLENPPKYAGETKTLSGQYKETLSDGFTVIYNKKEIKINTLTNQKPPKYGEILIYGKLKSDGSVDMIDAHNYSYNYLLYIISLIAGIIVIVKFFKEWKITKRGFESA